MKFEKIINKVDRGIGMLRLAKSFLPLETAVHFRYCCPIWGNASSKNVQGLQKLQNRAVRIVSDSPYGAHSEPLIKELGWHRLSDAQNRKLCNSRTDLDIPLLKTSSGQKELCLQWIMHFEQPFI